ncbi:YcxB family protein, partial [Ruminococcus sp.]
ILFIILLFLGIWFWNLPKKQIRDYISRTKDKIDLEAVNQYTFLPEYIRMMTTSSMEKYQLGYENLTWIRSDKRWIVLYFSNQDFTMLIDKQGFTHGNANACLSFLKNKQDGK